MEVKSEIRNMPQEVYGAVKLPRDYPWKLLAALTMELDQYLTPADIKELTTILRNRDVNRLLKLGGRWGLQCINPCAEGFSLDNSKAKYQLAAFLKKFQFSATRETLELRALEKFRDAEEQCRAFNREGRKALEGMTEGWKVTAITYAKAFIQKILGVILPEFEELTEWSRHGPGASLDTEGGKVSAFFKFENWPYQCTAAAYRFAKDAIRADERWLGALEDDYRRRFKIPKHALLDRRVFWQNVLKIVPGARIAFVPKNAEIFRTITIEPTLNVFLQLGVDGYIRRRLKRWGVDLDTQEKNQQMARIGSMEGEDPFVTVDLRGASETVTLGLCDYLLPDEWNSYLLNLRSPVCMTTDGEVFWLQKMSAMGNGFTFALESLIFASIIYGVMVGSVGYFNRNDMAVFGDDLIFRKSLAPRVLELLSDCGFTVNTDKSFFSGNVRESCGCDWVKGIPVRPVFLEDVPTNVKELLAVRNRLQRSLGLRWGIEESRMVKFIDRWIPEEFRDCIGPMSDTDFDSHIHAKRPATRGLGPIKDVWEYTRTVYRPCRWEVKGERGFMFRKLLHDLRPVQPEPEYLRGRRRKLAGKGSRFTVSLRDQETVGKERSLAYNWQDEYAEVLPALKWDA